MSQATLYCGDALEVLTTLPDESVQCCVTSPPYWGLRDYGVEGQLGLERTPEEYVEKMVALFAEVRRVLRKDGTLWLNMGDSYCTTPRGNRPGDYSTSSLTNPSRQDTVARGRLDFAKPSKQRTNAGSNFAGPHRLNRFGGLKGKDLIGMPWRLAFALQADGWWLRSDIIWSKPNPMPESVTDRPTKSHEYVFLLSTAERYYYDAAGIAEGVTSSDDARAGLGRRYEYDGKYDGGHETPTRQRAFVVIKPTRNARTVWEIATQPYPEAHFATFPEELARRCILAGSRPGDTVLDPFGGSGTVAQVATGNGRDSIYIDLNPKYVELAHQRIGPLLCTA